MSGPAIPVISIDDLPPPLLPPAVGGLMDEDQDDAVVECTIDYTAPPTLLPTTNGHGHISQAAGTPLGTAHQSGVGSDETCSICLEDLCKENSVQIIECQHVFHQSCITETWNHHGVRCPVCRQVVGEPQGRCPSGTMECKQLKSRPCPGFDKKTTTIELRYNIPSGIQLDYHEHPGQFHSSATRIAYLPDNKDGQNLLVRMKYAFMHGLLFTVGTSITTGIPNSVIWSSVHQKTSLNGGTHGFPDDLYLDNCHTSLNNLHVPSASDILKQQHSDFRKVSGKYTYTAPRVLSQTHGLQRYLRTYQPRIHSPQNHATTNGNNDDTTTNYYYEPQGRSPSGSMSVSVLADQACPGFATDATTTTIQIVYYLPSGKQQMSYHPNPGIPYGPETTRIAYLPNNVDGRKLLRRLKYAWKHGLTFTVGTSLTTGQPNRIIWTSIPHKTSLSQNGGPYGFPDLQYIPQCHAALDKLRVPPADLCL